MFSFLEGQYLKTVDPFELSDMDVAVDRILQSLDQNENIVVYGDFDADGVTSTVLLTEALRGLGFERQQVRPYIPSRVDEGYGLNIDALTKIKEEYSAHLVITVDCGIRSIQEVEHANRIGLDMIVTDHHSIGAEIPPALAVINPKRADCTYPEEMLAGVGIAYKLACALHAKRPNQFDTTSLLDLVAIGTVADVAPLVGENRRLVIDGLEVINRFKRPGVAALAAVAGVQKGQIRAETIGFALGPRINAAGRIGPELDQSGRPARAYMAAKLLATDNVYVANAQAEALNQLNRDRQRITNQLNERAESLIDDIDGAKLLFAADEGFVAGVIGLVAGKLKERYYRPSIVLEVGETESHGSCRSIPELNITEALDEAADLLVRYGGHAAAAGLTIENEKIPQFQQAITNIISQKLGDVELIPTVTIDAEIDIVDVDWALYDTLQQLEPTGCANATPIFLSRGVEVIFHRAVGQNQSHLQLEIAQSVDKSIKCIAFGLGHWGHNMPPFIDIVYTIGRNDWKGRKSLQLQIQDIKPQR